MNALIYFILIQLRYCLLQYNIITIIIVMNNDGDDSNNNNIIKKNVTGI